MGHWLRLKLDWHNPIGFERLTSRLEPLLKAACGRANRRTAHREANSIARIPIDRVDTTQDRRWRQDGDAGVLAGQDYARAAPERFDGSRQHPLLHRLTGSSRWGGYFTRYIQ